MSGAHQRASHGRARHAVLVSREQAELLQRDFWIDEALGAEERLPELLVEGSEPGFAHGLLIEAGGSNLAAPLRQSHPLVGRHRLLRTTDADVAATRAVVLGVPFGDRDE